MCVSIMLRTLGLLQMEGKFCRCKYLFVLKVTLMTNLILETRQSFPFFYRIHIHN